ncbi:MAG: CO dehydrogenase/acetyl-CoA synthase complex subunit epsilon [Candidatus Nezhaarchaeota archaeon]|nr:CO dehydrogenase/acetyl-CoA synthase complex subunit epsilon [Candidatus Nezhaarchaeota archaeon]
MPLLTFRASPWQYGNVPGFLMASCPDNPPKVFAALIKRAKNPLLVVGGYMYSELGGKLLLDYAIEVAKRAKCPVVSTAHTFKLFLERNFPAVYMSLVDIVNRLQDPKFTVDPSRPPPHDLAMFLGIRYEFASQGLATLKHFAPHLKTMTLCKWYHPNADWSFPNVGDEEWKKLLEDLIQSLG